MFQKKFNKKLIADRSPEERGDWEKFLSNLEHEELSRELPQFQDKLDK